jgi:hypothetical protein
MMSPVADHMKIQRPCKHETANTPVCNGCESRRAARARWLAKNPSYHHDNYLITKATRSEKAKLKYAANRKANQEASRRRYAANAERIKENARRYRANNLDKLKKRHHNYYLNNIEKFQARANKSEAERQKDRDRVRRHNEAHPEQRLKRVAARRAMKLGCAVDGSFTWRDVAARDGYCCYICGLKTIPDCPDLKLRPTVDHLKPLIAGGSHSLDRSALAHFSCNCSKGKRELEVEAVPADFRKLCRFRIKEYIKLVISVES